MGLRSVSVALARQGAVVQPGEKVALKLRTTFLSGMRKAFAGQALLNKLYDVKIEDGPPDGDSCGLPEYYMPTVSLKADWAKKPDALSQVIVAHLGGQSIKVSADEKRFLQVFIIPLLLPRVVGDSIEDKRNVFPCQAMKTSLLWGVRSSVLEKIDQYLPKP